MSPFDQTFPFMVAPEPAWPFAPRYFEVNMTVPENTNAADYTNSVSTSCNYVDNMSVVAWAYADLGGTYYIDYKTNIYGGTTGYTYKPAGTKRVTSNNRVRVYPNPANEKLIIEVGQAGRYTVHNVLGQIMTEGTLVAGEQAISLHAYPTGTYIISICKDGKQYRTGSFVKQQ